MKKCKKCSEDNQENAKFCKNCGSENDRTSTSKKDELVDTSDAKVNFFEISHNRLVFLMIITLGVYSLYWFGRNFQAIQKIRKLRGENTHYVLWAIFSPLTSEILFKEIRKLGIKSNSITIYPHFLSVIYFIGAIGLSILWRGSEDIIQAVGTAPFILLLFVSMFIKIYPISLSQKVFKDIRLNEKNSQNHKITTKYEKGEIILVVLATILGILALIGTFFTTEVNTKNIPKLVEEVKKDLVLPQKVDDTMTLENITAEENAVRYHYSISGLVDTSSLTNESIKSTLKPDICSNNDLKDILNRGINLEYSYSVDFTSNGFFVVINKYDCL